MKGFVLVSFFFAEFANSNPVEGINEGILQMTFLELRQVRRSEIKRRNKFFCSEV